MDTEDTTMTVRVVDRGTSRSYTGVNIRTVTIPAVCPKCGGPRGGKYPHNFCEDGEWMNCDRWDNPCGHTDYYSAVLEEARREAKYVTIAAANGGQS
jgi:hypothetical protein